MKNEKKFLIPEAYIIELQNQDIITSSGDPDEIGAVDDGSIPWYNQ